MSTRNDKTALITGGGSGIGLATAMAFARRGYRVCIADLNLPAATQAAEAIAELGGEALPLQVDIGDPTSVAALFERLRKEFTRLDAAFNNAGVGGNALPLAEIEEDDWARCLQINLSGAWRCLKHEIRWMLDSGGGAIVNNCSIFGLVGGSNACYTAAKHGIAGLTKSAALSYAASGIRVNAVCPGLIESGMGLRVLQRAAERAQDVIGLHPVGRVGTPDEVANAVLWLCSADASFVHGHMLNIDGGYCAR